MLVDNLVIRLRNILSYIRRISFYILIIFTPLISFTYFFQDTINKLIYPYVIEYLENYKENSYYVEKPNFGIDREKDLIHQDWVGTLFVTGKFIVSGSDDKTIKIWKLENGELLTTIKAHDGHIQSIFVEHNKVISASNDKTIKIWDINSGKLLKTLRGHTEAVFSIFVKNNYIVSGSADKKIFIWEIDSGKLIKSLEGHSERIFSIFVRNNKIISGSDDNTIKIWDMESGKLLNTLKKHTASVRSIYVTGEYIVSGGYDKTIKVWNLNTGELILNIEHNGKIGMNEISMIKNKIIVASWTNNSIIVYTLSDNYRKVLSKNNLEMIEIDNDSIFVYKNKVFAGTTNGIIHIWDLNTGKHIKKLNGFPFDEN